MINLIIAKYNEDIHWINNLDSKFNNVIYNKGNDNSHIKLENVGRESGTYIYYILNHYYNLPNWNIFCQGDPFPHCNKFISLINNFNYLQSDIIYPLGDHIYISNDEGFPHHPGLPIKRYCEFLNLKNNNEFKFPPGAQFLVHKNLILKHPFEFWIKCKELHNEHIAPWVFERLWLTIFSN